jgi:hypothetical protein
MFTPVLVAQFGDRSEVVDIELRSLGVLAGDLVGKGILATENDANAFVRRGGIHGGVVIVRIAVHEDVAKAASKFVIDHG